MSACLYDGWMDEDAEFKKKTHTTKEILILNKNVYNENTTGYKGEIQFMHSQSCILSTLNLIGDIFLP